VLDLNLGDMLYRALFSHICHISLFSVRFYDL